MLGRLAFAMRSAGSTDCGPVPEPEGAVYRRGRARGVELLASIVTTLSADHGVVPVASFTPTIAAANTRELIKARQQSRRTAPRGGLRFLTGFRPSL